MVEQRWLSIVTACLVWFFSIPGALAFEQTDAIQAAPTMCCNPTTGVCVPASSSTNVQAATSAASGHLDLDLSSTARTIQVDSTVPISVRTSDGRQVINPGDLLTPAQFVAVTQLVASGAQAIRIGDLGNAIGGTFALNSALSQQIGDLVVPKGVNVVHDFGTAAALNLAGDLTNAGNFYAISSNAAVTAASIAATNITNLQGARLTSILPTGGLSGFNNVVSHLDLNLSAVNNIINQGVISSSGNLTMNAGGAISNQAVMTAAQNVSVMSTIGSITNSGLIAATAGNINIASQVAQSLAINNSSGTLSALNGSINAQTTNAASSGIKPSLSVLGGNLLAREVNLTNLNGVVEVDVEDVTGPINISAGAAHVTASTQNLMLGEMNLTGDPTFYNTGGDITITSNLDLRPRNFTAPGPVALAIVAEGDIKADSGVDMIDVSTVPNSLIPLPTAPWPGAVYSGSILLVAGAQFSATPDDSSSSAAPPGDTTSTLTITGASANGGSINLAGVNIGSQAGCCTPPPSPYTAVPTSSASGNVMLVAYSGTTNPSSGGNITVGDINTGEQLSPANDISGLNGTVSILGEGNITTGAINTTGNIANANIYNGTVTIASAAVKMLQSTESPQNTFVVTYATIQDATDNPGMTTFNISNATGITAGQNLYLDPLGPNSERVTVSSVSGNAITIAAPLTKYHVQYENIYTDASQVVINPGAGTVPSTPITTNGGTFAPDMGNLKNGTITIGGNITSGADVTVSTNGSAVVSGSITLTQNPNTVTPTPPKYVRYPSINIFANTGVTVNAGAIINSQIAGCSLCPNTVNITTQSLTNNGLITGGAANSSPFSNAFVNITSTGNLTILGTGNITVPSLSVISVAAADKSTLNLNSAQTFNTGTQSLVILNAQGQGGTINVAANTTESITGGPVISINTPNLVLNNGSQFSASGASTFAIGSGYTAHDLTVTVSGTATISTAAGGAIKMRPTDGQNLNITASSPATLVFSGANALLATSGSGQTSINDVTIAAGTATKVNNPSGGILGAAFQPFVGGQLSDSNLFVAFAGYPYHVVLALLGPIVAEQQFQQLATYTQQNSAGYVIQAAKQVGLRVSAGVFVVIDDSGSITNQTVVTSDIQSAFYGASKFGNVADIVVGNENIVGDAAPGPSITTLNNLITQVKATRNATLNPLTETNFTSQTLPITTRQTSGVLNLVKTSSQMVTLVKNVEQYIYGNFYPFYNEDTVVPTLIAHPNISQPDFQKLVNTYMSKTFDENASNFKTYVITNIPDIRVGETGWATPLQGYTGSSLPQQNTTWASWYYPAMQDWSFTHSNPLTGDKGVTIAGYFETYNEPWKGIDGANPNKEAVTLNANASAGATTILTTSNTAFNTLTPMSVLINPRGTTQEVQNITSISGFNLNISPLVNSHNSGEILHAGTPEEPFFGIWVAQGSNRADGATYTLTAVQQKYALPVYSPSAPPPPPPPPAAALPPIVHQIGVTAASSSSSAAATNTQIATRIATDYTPHRNQLNNTSIVGITDVNISEAGTSPYSELGEAISGWQSSEDGSVWHCPGCLGGDNNGSTQNAARLIWKVAQYDGSQIAQATPKSSASSPQPPSGSNAGGSSFFNLPKGVALFNAKAPVVVGTQEGEVYVQRGSLAFVVETGNDVAIYNLHDTRNGDVKVVVAKRLVTLRPGKQLVLTRKPGMEFAQINPGTKIGYRNPKPLDLGGGIYGFIADFSIPSAVINIPPLKNIVKSDKRSDRKMARQLLKNAVILANLSATEGPYKSGP